MGLEEQIKLLIELQKFDSDIYKLKGELDTIPVHMRGLEEDFEGKKAALNAAQDHLKNIQVKRKEKEGDLQVKEGVIKKHQAQLYQVKTNKEYSALQQEIGGLKADCSVIEEDVIKYLDEIDEAQKRIEKEKELLSVQENKFKEEKKIKESEAKKIQADIDSLNNERKSLAEKVDKQTLSRYERILIGKGGLAVVPVVGDACGGCHMNLPPQVVNEAKMRIELVFCGTCARILYAGD
ncbi:MAG: hypothetical protein HQ593_04085 [Candidatus Omnitrophica bacterium]|nr:hypothetical protein [Candidatus Omnitrophota bacterium]